ncbi:MAG: serine protease [Bacteroidales bacterium]|nr:serine protease [Bacteroidales bacterium]
MYRIINIFLFIQLFCLANVFSQITKPGELKSNKLNKLKTNEEIPVISMPSFNVEQMLVEDKLNEKRMDKPLRFAKVFEVDIDIKKEGLLNITEDGQIWRLKIQSSGAYSLNFIFKDYELPAGAELYLYNIDKTQIIGALTDINNNDSKIVPVRPIKGDIAIIEYYEPVIASFKGNLKLCKVGHDYKGILNYPIEYDGRFGTSRSCNVDINCVEGNNWQNESHSVCRILINASGYCTGSLINNVNNDGRAYVLTANHCINTESAANNSVFVFNYESPTCNGSDGSIIQSISNSTLRASWATSDFSLVELSSVPPSDFNPYWNGWNNQNTTPTAPVVCIHHPAGDVKKISIDVDEPSNNGNFWRVIDWTVGTVEHGSSGAPFYNSNHRVVGQVHGGNNIFCSTSEISEYGKFSTSWTGGGTDATRLQNWLDPSNTVTELPGLRLIRNITITSNTPASGDIVRLINVSIQNGSNITIDFNNQFEATGTFDAPLGTTLNIQP